MRELASGFNAAETFPGRFLLFGFKGDPEVPEISRFS
jgi:hypothetical protein